MQGVTHSSLWWLINLTSSKLGLTEHFFWHPKLFFPKRSQKQALNQIKQLYEAPNIAFSFD